MVEASDSFTIYLYKAVLYVFFGCTMEVSFSVLGIEKLVGKPIPRRVPKNYLEGFISLYMFPIYALGLPLAFEPTLSLIQDWPIFFRYLFWCVSITATEALLGFFYLKTIGHYPWDYYKLSRWKVFEEGLTLWTLLPFWGVAGLMLEIYSAYLNYSSPSFLEFLKNFF